MTDVALEYDTDLRTWLVRSYGLSGEDADKVIGKITHETIRQMQQQSPPTPPRAEPLRVMQTVEGTGEAMIVRNWVNIEAMAADLAPQVATLIADAVVREMQRRVQE